MEDNKRECSSDKKLKIRESLAKTRLRRSSQVVKVFECKIVEKRLNKKQREQLEMLFVEGKWFYNHMLNLHKDMSLRDINACSVKEVNHLDKDKNVIHTKLEYISGAEKQAIQARMISNEKAIKTIVKKGLQKHGSLKFKSELNCIPLTN